MRRHLKQTFWASDGDPGPLAWCLASVSVILPIAGLLLCLAGGWLLWRHKADGGLLLGLGMVALVADIAIDLIWAHPGITISDLPDLNRRAAQLVGRPARVSAAIRNGRGTVRIGDSEWPAEGPDLEPGARARVTGVRGIGVVVDRD